MLPSTCRAHVIVVLALALPPALVGASWTPLANPAPGAAGVMMLLTDGTVMVQRQQGSSDFFHWMRLTPDAQGSYIKGTWTQNPIAPMSTPRFGFASHVLPNGKVWILGGEYSGTGLAENDTPTGEIYDPVANSWSPIASFPAQPDCYVGQFGGNIASGSPIMSNIVSTANWQAGWNVSGQLIPSGTTILSVDSPTQVHLSANATGGIWTALTLTFNGTGNTLSGSNVITGIASTAGWQTGWAIAGPGIPSGATIGSIDSGSQIKISANATATATGTSFTFTFRTQPSSCYGDSASMLLPGTKILAASIKALSTYIYDVASDTWSPTGSKVNSYDKEEGWVTLADGTVLTYDLPKTYQAGTGYAERYNPVTGKWSSVSPGDKTAGGSLPALSTPAMNEMGPLIRLLDDRILAIGANNHTALYTPSTNTWAAGPDISGVVGGAPLPFGADDAPAAILPNGHVIFTADAAVGITSTGSTTTGSAVVTAVPSTSQLRVGWAVSGTGIPSAATIKSIDSPSQVTLSGNATASGNGAIVFGGRFSPPAQLFDFDPASNQIAPVSPALQDNQLTTIPAYKTWMLMLPTGQLLLADNTQQLYIYTPDGTAPASLVPSVSAIAPKGTGVFTLTGSRLSGQSAGATYGDDAESDENYPIIRFTSSSGNVYYARTTNWSYIGVGAGPASQTADFTLNSSMPGGTYTITVCAAGLQSVPVSATVSQDRSSITFLPSATAVQDATSARAAIVPGQWTAIYGVALSNTTRLWGDTDFKGGTTPGSPLPTALDGVSVTIGGKPAAIYYVSPTQINLQAPANLPAGSADVVVSNNGVTAAVFPVTVVQSSPSFFYYGAGTSLFPLAVHLTAKLIGDPAISGGGVERAHPGELLLFFANGLAASQAGVVVPPAAFTPTVTVSAGTYPLAVQGAALVSAGEFQINAQLPPDIPPGLYALSLTVPGGSTATAGVTVLLPVGP